MTKGRWEVGANYPWAGTGSSRGLDSLAQNRAAPNLDMALCSDARVADKTVSEGQLGYLGGHWSFPPVIHPITNDDWRNMAQRSIIVCLLQLPPRIGFNPPSLVGFFYPKSRIGAVAGEVHRSSGGAVGAYYLQLKTARAASPTPPSAPTRHASALRGTDADMSSRAPGLCIQAIRRSRRSGQ